MPKIPNYSPVHEEEPHGGYKWEHENKELMTVQVTKNISENEKFNEGFWRVEIWEHAHMTELGPISKNKEDMREIAVDWMRDHPEGWEDTDHSVV